MSAAAPKTLRVCFNPPALPPAVLVAGDVVVQAGGEADLPADLAQELAANPAMHVSLVGDAPTDAGTAAADTTKE